MGTEVEVLVVLEGDEDLVPETEVVRTKVEVAVGPAVLVELEMGNDQLVVVAVVVEVRPGQLETVGLH